MNYLLLLYGDESAERQLSPEERRSIVNEHISFHATLRQRGVLVEGKPLDGRAGAFTVRLDIGGKRLVTDGPFAETKEQIGSFYLVECAGREEAVAIASEVPRKPRTRRRSLAGCRHVTDDARARTGLESERLESSAHASGASRIAILRSRIGVPSIASGAATCRFVGLRVR
jgi:hypothetical protein